MMKKCGVLAFLGVIMLSGAFGQTTSPDPKKSGGKPNIPGNFVVEFGFNRPLEKDSLFSIGFWGSRTINVYYQRELRLFKSKFSFVPGIGLSMERYKLKNLHTLAYRTTDPTDEVELVPGNTAVLRKSMIVTNYIEVPLELRFSTRPNDPARSFKVSAGARFGYLLDSFNKLKYREQGETKIAKDKQRFNMNQFRYGTFVKI
jgi:hypothetical protein